MYCRIQPASATAVGASYVIVGAWVRRIPKMSAAAVSVAKRQQPFPEVALRWLESGPKAFIEEEIKRARAEQQGIKDRIRSSIQNYLNIKKLRSSS